MKRFRIAIFASGSGSNAEKIMAHFRDHAQVEVACVVYNQAQAGVVEKAKKWGIKTQLFSNADFETGQKVVAFLVTEKINWIVLAGFLRKIPSPIIQSFPERILNIHPALLPKYGGKGMYGKFVHQAVKAAGENETGISIHLVNEHFDEGKILAQFKTSIFPEDNEETIAKKVQELEHQHFSSIIEQTILNTH